MNPVDRNQGSPRPHQDAQASPQSNSSEQDFNGLLQANIANVNAASTSRPVTVPSHTADIHFLPMPSSRILPVVSALINYSPNYVHQHIANNPAVISQLNSHQDLLADIEIPRFEYTLINEFMDTRNRLLLNDFIRKVLTALKGLKYLYHPEVFIVELLMFNNDEVSSDQTTPFQSRDELLKIISTYMPNTEMGVYLDLDWYSTWPRENEIRSKQDLLKAHVIISKEDKIAIHQRAEALRQEKEQTKVSSYVQAAFAYGVSPGSIKHWDFEGKKLLEQQKKTLASQASAAQAQAQSAASFVVDEQIPGTSDGRSARATRGRAALRFEPYQRPVPSIIQTRATELGLTPERLQEFNIGAAFTSEFNAQMRTLSWPIMRAEHSVQDENHRCMIIPAFRMEIGRFIITECPADERVYHFAASHYGVKVTEIIKWASDASD